ncbi:MAG: GAF domain-containing protein [Anaerolineales bacterium]|nr:GAF domain-containing protein [Anaerolineales bacterium]MDW8278463.1 adenylate/guanylate cyclase domain-containing protein [Anaerolineales bacterium]
MMTDSTPVSVDLQIKALSQAAGKLRAALLPVRASLPPNTLEELSQLESRLYRVSQEVAAFAEERKNLIALTEIGQVVNSSLELDQVLRIVMDNIIKLTEAERGFLMLRDESGHMTTRIARNWEQESLNESEYAVSRTVIQRVIETGEAVLTTNAQEDPRFGGQESIIAFNLRSILCVPLKVKNDLIGVIYTDNRIRTGIFTESERDLLVAFGNQAAIAIDNARLFASLRRTLAEVTELKNMMDNIFASIASGVITADIEDKVILCNRAAENILGQSIPQILGRRLDEIVPTVAGDLLPRVQAVRMTDMRIADLEITHTLPERGTVDWRLNLSPLKDAEQTTQGVAIVLDDLTERKRLEAQRKLFERMVSPAVIQQLDPNSLALGGKRTDITVLFADIRGFTSFSETLSPEQLVSILNRYLAAGAEAVLDEEGTIDKFLGDAVMAWFNAPIPQPDHTLRAVRAALKLRDRIHELHASLPPEAHLAFGVGIHYGDAVLGLIGTEKRLEYTAIGDSVNTTKRLQENAARNQIVISQAAYERVQDCVDVRPMEPMTVKGKRESIPVYEVLGLK